MGRLTKTKVDEIARLRKQGYTQKETAEKVNAHLRTVRKYDPLHESKPREEKSLAERMTAVEEGLRTCWDLLYLLHTTMLFSDELSSNLEQGLFSCPRCGEYLSYEDYGDGYYRYHCWQCDFKIPLFSELCYKCLSQGEIDLETDDYVCRKCGTPRYTPYNL